MCEDTDVTALHYATLVSPHLSVVIVSQPFGSDTHPPSGPGPGAPEGIYLSCLFTPHLHAANV